jgi:hypothetical protein
MAALPARNIRNVETDTREVRPRDAAIQKASLQRSQNYQHYSSKDTRTIKAAANDNNPLWYAANDNAGPAYPTVTESFMSQAGERTIQSTLSQNNTRNAQTETRKRISAASRGARTIRGVSSDTGMRPSLRQPSIKKLLPNIPLVEVNPVTLARASTLSATHLTWGLGLWSVIQVPLAVISFIFLGITYVAEDVVKKTAKEVLGGTVYSIGSSITSSLSEAVGWVIGVDLAEIANPANYFMGGQAVVFILGLATLLIIGISYQLSFINCLYGKHAGLKIGTFILALFGYMIPIFNIIPWFIFWVLVVWRYPE